MVARSLLKSSRPQNQDENEDKRVILLSATLLESLSEKRLEYENQPIQFTSEFEQNSQFAFINVQLSPFSRSISNLINNAAQAFQGNPGAVTLKLYTD